MGQFSNSFPKHFSYLCEYAFICDLSCSFCEYPIIFHCLHCSPSCFDPDSLLLAYFWLGLSWIDLDLLYFNKQKLFISKNKQQDTLQQQQAAGEAKHSAENTINLSGSKRQPVSAHRQQPRAVHPVRRVRANISRMVKEDGSKKGGRRREDSASA